jgi:hypothetical protein
MKTKSKRKKPDEYRPDRKAVLLAAAYELLKRQDRAHYVLEITREVVHYDKADCDGSCLMEDIAHELGIDED